MTPEAKTDLYCKNASAHESRAKNVVKRRLKNPDSAKFGASAAVYTGYCEFTVTGQVSAQNGFGGMSQSTYAAVTRWSHVNQKFELIDIAIK